MLGWHACFLSPSAPLCSMMLFSRLLLGVRIARAQAPVNAALRGGCNKATISYIPCVLARAGQHRACRRSSRVLSLASMSTSAVAPLVTDDDGTVSSTGEGGGGSMVRSISPSSVAAFKQCPRLFYYRWVLGLKSPASRESLKGILVHEVLSHFFELGKDSRDLAHLHELFRGVMTKLIAEEKIDPKHGYNKLFENREQERAWAVECLDLLANFIVFSNQHASDGDPVQVEFKMRHSFDDPDSGTAGGEAPDTDAAGGAGDESATMRVTGIIDRLDRCRDGKLRVVDYKTGKIPDLKYSQATNQRIMDEKFYQLQIYALLVERNLGETPGELRIIYLNGPQSATRVLEAQALSTVEEDLRSVWDEMLSCVERDTFPPRTSRLCDWCSFKDRCPAFSHDDA